jgi:hypothetical protein
MTLQTIDPDATHYVDVARELYDVLCAARFAMASAPDWMRHPTEYADEFAQIDAAVEKYSALFSESSGV